MSVRGDNVGDNALRARSRRQRPPARVMTCVAAALLAGVALATAPPTVRPGIEVWSDLGFAPLAGRRVGLVSNRASISAAGRTVAEVLAESSDLHLVRLFSPEHGFDAADEGAIADATDTRTGLPVSSLYGDTRRLDDAMLEGLEGLVFDIPDIGTRFYTYATTLAYVLEEVASRNLPIVVLDRPNPINGVDVGGPVQSESLRSFVGYVPGIPVRHGMTMGELAHYMNRELAIDAQLTVIPVQGWQRAQWHDETGLRWMNPSPNMRNPTQALLYPAVAPIEMTNVSVGRGTDEPFEWFGAPWMSSTRLAAALNDTGLPGVRFVPMDRTPTASRFADELCHGVHITVIDRDRFDSGRTAAAIVTSLRDLFGDAWNPANLPRLWGDERILDQLAAGHSSAQIVASWSAALLDFKRLRAGYLIYD